MEFFKYGTKIDFMRKRMLYMGVSLLLVILSFVSLFTQGLNLGLDFTGGTVVEIGYPEPVELSSVRDALTAGGFERAIVQYFGTSQDVLIRLPPEQESRGQSASDKVVALLEQQSGGQAELKRVDFVGPQVGEELKEQGGLAVLFALVGVLIYVALRFEYRFALAAVIATAHDVIITVGFFSVTQTEFDLSVLASVLAVLGYSLNDTIVVFDRVRENFRKLRNIPVTEVLNISVNETLSRTVMTGGSTLLVLLSLLFLGGPVLYGFSLALLIGVLVGTYSSIYIASPWLLVMGVTKADLMPVKKEGEDPARP